MPRKRRSVAGLVFTPFGDEQRKAFALLVNMPGLKGVFDEIAQDGQQLEGRGLVVWVSPTGRVDGLKPPVFIAAGAWRRFPILVNTPHPDLLRALITYNPKTSYVLLIVGGADDGQAGQYMWWIEPFAQPRGQSNPLLS